MLSGLFKTVFEPFTVSQADLASQERLRYYYGDKKPNAILSSSDSNLDLGLNTTTFMGMLNSEITGGGLNTQPANFAGEVGLNRKINAVDDGHILKHNSLTKNLLETRNAACMSLGTSPSQFAHLTSLAANVDPASKMRCGWIYNTANPSDGRGAYGTIDGPAIKSSVTGTWMWDLAKAKEQYHSYICSNAGLNADCSSLSNVMYNNICGYCKSSKKFIPISGSSVAYPYSNNTCSASNLITKASMCPKPAPPPPAGSPAAAAWMAARGACDPLMNGSLPRDCLIKTAAQAGCSNSGALITALQTASDTNYLDTLMQAQSYITYQQRSASGLNETALKTGKITLSDALTEFQDVYNAASSSPNLGLKTAASDLCFTKGLLEQYDFCAELQPTDKGPFSLECLQAAFKRAGGQETGSMYPCSANPGSIVKWNSFNTWGDVMNEIGTLVKNSGSTDRKIQQRAIGQFQGIPLDNKASPQFALNSVNNVEIFWFTSDTNLKGSGTYNTIFLGRRIRSQIPNLQNTSGVRGALAETGSFVYFTNMAVTAPTRFKLQFTGDSGFIFARNRGSTVGGTRSMPMTNDYNLYSSSGIGNGVDVPNQELSSLYNSFQGSAQMVTQQPWTLQPNVANVITGYYLGNGKNFGIIYKQESDVPEYCGCYGSANSDKSLRIYNKSECDALNGIHYPSGECLIKTGGSYTWNCRGLNNQNPCANSWGPIPGSMLYLIQDPYAPMITFNVIQTYSAYNCDFYFMDKRLSSHKMKWKIYNGNGPTPSYAPAGILDSPSYPLGLSYMRFVNGSGIMSQFQIKIYSFVTLVYIVRFNKVPTNGMQSNPFILWSSYPSIDYPTIFVVGKGNNTAQINVGSLLNPTGTTNTTNAYGCTSPPKTSDGPIIRQGETYIITLSANRSNPSDIDSLNSLTVGAGLLSDLQNRPASLQKSSALVWPNPKSLDNKDSGASNFFLITGDANCQYDLFSLQMYDYILSDANLGHAANDDWPLPARNSPNSPATDQNPYL